MTISFFSFCWVDCSDLTWTWPTHDSDLIKPLSTLPQGKLKESTKLSIWLFSPLDTYAPLWEKHPSVEVRKPIRTRYHTRAVWYLVYPTNTSSRFQHSNESCKISIVWLRDDKYCLWPILLYLLSRKRYLNRHINTLQSTLLILDDVQNVSNPTVKILAQVSLWSEQLIPIQRTQCVGYDLFTPLRHCCSSVFKYNQGSHWPANQNSLILPDVPD